MDVNKFFVPTSMIQMHNVNQFNLPGLKFGEEGSSEQFPVLCKCIYIESLDQIDLMDELIYL
jgi:hypothetical protein